MSTWKHYPTMFQRRLVRDFNIYARQALMQTSIRPGPHYCKNRTTVLWSGPQENEGHWLPTRSAIIEEVLTDYSRFSSRSIILPKSHSADHGLLPTTIDPPEHHFYRKTLNHSYGTGIGKCDGEDIRAIVVSLIDDFVDQGQCNLPRILPIFLPIRISVDDGFAGR